MYKILPWSKELDLTEFYAEAERRGFKNNNSQAAMIDCFVNEKKFSAWILYKDNKPVGSVAAHSFDDVMGPDSFRVLARTCAFGTARPNYGLTTLNRMIVQHQHLTDQFMLPICLEWCQSDNVYATSNNSPIASQRLVHKHYFPTLAKLGIVEFIKEINYRSTDQTVWKIHVEKFYTSLGQYPRWK